MKVVCDAGPLIHLDELDILFLLTDFEEVLVPRAVWTEVARHRKEALSDSLVKFRKSTEQLVPSNVLSAMARAFSLDLGEIEALALVEKYQDCIFFTDDAAARLVADRMGFRVHGTIGLIVRAIRRNQLSPEKVVEILSALPEKSTLYIKADLLNNVITRIKKKFGI